MRTPRKRDCLLLACYVPPHSLAVPVTLQTSLRQRVHRAGRSPALISGCAGTFDATSSLIQGDPTRPYLPLLARVHVLTACVPLVAQSSTSSHRAPRQADWPAVRMSACMQARDFACQSLAADMLFTLCDDALLDPLQWGLPCAVLYGGTVV